MFDYVFTISIISTDEDPSLRIESSAIINLRGVSTKLNKYTLYLYFKLWVWSRKFAVWLHKPAVILNWNSLNNLCSSFLALSALRVSIKNHGSFMQF